MSSSKIIHALLSDPGRVRRHNEDAGAASPATGAYIICDGMGGAAAGEVASRLAIDTFLDHIETYHPVPRIEAASTPRPLSDQLKPQTRLHAAVHAANHAVFDEAARKPGLSGMGTTLVALLHVPGPLKDRRSTPRSPASRFTTPPTLFLANVGDSRCYRRRAGGFVQLTTDHSFVEEQVRAGQITADQAANSPMRNYITRAIGPHPHIEPDIHSYRPFPGDLYLLTSDGLTRELTDEAIAATLAKHVPTPVATEPELESACAALIEAANASGGHDNITVLLLAFV